jgi:hypothetical protein
MKKEFSLIISLGILVIAVVFVLLIWTSKDQQIEADPEVIVFSFKEGDVIESPLVVEGKAKGTWFFEASFPIKVVDQNDNILGYSYVTALGEWMTEEYVDFRGEIEFTSEEEKNGFFVFMKDNPSGLPEYDKEIRIPVVIKPSETMTVNVYFSNNELNPEIICDLVFPVERIIPKIQTVGRSSIEELLAGPTTSETAQGYFTSINPGVVIQDLRIDQGIAYIDFNDQLESQIGGSCNVSAISAQIVETLKQFPTVDNVVISINGRTEDILQP